MTALESSAPWCFAGFELDLRRRELRSSHGPRALEPRLLHVLAYLIHHRDRTVAPGELIRRVWRLRRLGPSSVPTAIGALRRALGDDPRRPRFIRTVMREGYRFVAELQAPAIEPEALRHSGWRAIDLGGDVQERLRQALASALPPDDGPLLLVISGAGSRAYQVNRGGRNSEISAS